MMKLYGYWRSTAAYRVRIALTAKEIGYENISVDLVKSGGEQNHADYLALNPQKLVPTLVDDGFTISQSMAIIEYLDEVYPQFLLISGNAQQKAKIRAMAQSIACDIHPLNNLRVLQYLKKSLNHSQAEVDEWYSNWISLGFEAIETQLFNTKGLYCFGNEISLADVFLVPQVYNANRFNVSMDNYPQINEINSNCLQLEAFKISSPDNQHDAK